MFNQLEQDCRDNRHIRQGVIDNRYLLLDYVGGGGTACVYKVRTRDDPHEYALKLLQDRFFQEDWVRDQFRKEGERLLLLNHPNIVRFYALEIKQDYAYLLMEHVQGYALSQMIRNLRDNQQFFPVNEVMRTLIQASRALNFLHDNDLIHRDIKSSNILLQQGTGKVYLVDFGIAAEAQEVESAINAGTRAYMPPEQQERIGIPVTTAADLYAFGIVAYEMLVGRRPFYAADHLTGKEAEIDLVRKHIAAPVPSLHALRPELPPEIDKVFDRILAKHPNDRYPNARAFVEDLHRVLKPQLKPELHRIDEVTALDPTRALAAALKATRPRQESEAAPQSNRLALIGGGLTLIIAAMLGLGVFFLSQGGSEPEPTAVALVEDTATATATASATATETATASATASATATATATASATPSATASPTPTQTATASATATPSNTPPPSATPIPDPFEGLPFFYFLEGDAAFDPSGGLAGLLPLNTGAMGAFRVEAVAALDQVQRVGVAYRLRDDDDYMLFALDPANRTWEILAVTDGQPERLQRGALQLPANEPLESLTAMGIDDTFRFEVNNEVILAYLPDAPASGRLALLLDLLPGVTAPSLEVKVGTVGDEAIRFAAASPTPTRPLEALLGDVQTLLGTGNFSSLSINCAVYMPTYEKLENYLSSEPILAQRAINSGKLVYELCADSRRASLTLVVSDYLNWENAIKQAVTIIQNAQ